MITVANFDDLTEALLLRSRLEAEGIPAFVPDEFTAQNDWLLINAIGGIRVQVPEGREEEAGPIVDEFLDECDGYGAFEDEDDGDAPEEKRVN